MKYIFAFLLTLFVSVTPLFAGVNPARTALLDTLFLQLERHIANPVWLEGEAYAALKDSLYSQKAMQLSDDSFLGYFNQQVESLPFTHFYLRKTQAQKPTDTSAQKKKKEEVLMWKELNPQTAYLMVQTFSSDASAMIKALSEIGTDTYDNLIIDLRNNPGGTLDAPVILGRFLTNESVDVGVFMTRQWFEENDHLPTADEVADLPYLTEFTYAGIGKMFAQEAAFRLVIPGHEGPVFKGKVYALQNGNTGSANEPLLDAFKEQGLATLVGSITAGAMLSAYYFPVNDEYRVFIPTADYQTAYGRRIDKEGVQPDIETDPDKALDYVLEELIPEGL